MTTNPTIALLGRRLRLAVIGGGPGSFIGGMHRLAARLDDQYELVSGVLSSDPKRAIAAAKEIGFPEDRQYSTVSEMLLNEQQRQDGADVIAIMTPNDTHFSNAMTALEHGFDVICDKPMTNTVEEAQALHQKAIEAQRIFCLTHNYSGYPMTRQARGMVLAGEVGEIRLVQVEYVQGGKADESKPDPTSGHRSWTFDPKRNGLSLILGAIGTHAHHLVRFITNLEITEVCAEAGAIVPGRKFDDYTGALLRLNNGARGVFWVTQAAAGVENCLQIRVSGSKGTLEWCQEIPQRLSFKPLGAPAQTRTPNGPGTLDLSRRASRIVAGHPEGFPAGFANIYKDAAEAIASRIAGQEPDPLALHFPTSADGLAGMLFIDAVIRSNNNNSSWEVVKTVHSDEN